MIADYSKLSLRKQIPPNTKYLREYTTHTKSRCAIPICCPTFSATLWRWVAGAQNSRRRAWRFSRTLSVFGKSTGEFCNKYIGLEYAYSLGKVTTENRENCLACFFWLSLFWRFSAAKDKVAMKSRERSNLRFGTTIVTWLMWQKVQLLVDVDVTWRALQVRNLHITVM